MNNRKRNVQIKFRITEEEHSLIEEKMKQVPTSNMETYLRKIGVNINQIAKIANATGNVYQEDIEKIKGALKEIWRLQRLSLLKGH